MKTRVNKNEKSQSFDYATWGTCSSMIHVETEDGVIKKVYFVGIRCGAKPTSCPDQLAQALRSSLEM